MANPQPNPPGYSQYSDEDMNRVGTQSPVYDPRDMVLQDGASWFYWISGLTVVNSVIQLMGMDFSFLCGLGVTQFLDAFGSLYGEVGMGLALAADLVCVTVIVGLGLLASNRQLWAFWVGIVLMLIDVLPYIFLGEGTSQLIGIGMHAFIIYKFFTTWQACR